MGYFDNIRGTPDPPAGRLTVVPAVTDPGNTTKYAAAALRKESELVASAGEGFRNDALNKAYFNLGRHVGAGSIDAETVRSTLAAAARQAGLPQQEIDIVLREDSTSALKAGVAIPRVPAPLESTQIPVATILLEKPPDSDDRAALIRSQFPVLNFTDLLNADDDGEEWIVEPLLAARRLVALYSAPKIGKSLLMLEIAVAIALGREVIGVTPERRRVLYVDFENDPRGDIKRRLEAMGFGPEDGEDLNEGLCYLSFPTLAKLDTQQGGFELLATASEYGCEVVVIDTVSRAVGGEENDNDTWLAFYRDTGMHLKGAGIACIRLDHSGKDADKGMRGGSAKYGDVDAVWKLSADSETVLNLDCTDHRMPVEHDHVTLVRESHPTLHHRLVGDRTMALDYREREIDEAIDKLGIDISIGANATYKRLREAGKGFNKQSVLRVVKARKLRFQDPSSGGSGTTLEPPGTTPEVGGSRSPLRSRAPEPLQGNRFPEPEPLPLTKAEDPDTLASCSSCFRPTTSGVASKNAGRCFRCAHDAGLETT